MKTKKYKQGLVTSLTALSTAMLCQTAATYASDIEIYKAPTTGGATLMLVLDMSTSMKQPSNSDKSGYGNPINADFGISCSRDTAFEENISRTFVDSDNNSTTYSFKGTFCKVSTATVNG